MSKNCDLSNYEIAKAEADKVDEQIIAALKAGRSFRVEAGAGSGKTYSLNRVIEWIQANKWKDYRRKKQNVICEPIYEALSTSNMQLLFDTLGIRRYPITKKSEKMKWKEFEARLKKARDGKAIDVINTIVETKLVPVPSLVDGYYHLYFDAPDTIYGLDATIRDVLDLDYSQFRAAIEFLYPEAEFSTEHGVKGEEYDNVVFVISKGWNQYQFETYAPMITGRTPIPNGKQTSYERNRNLFYVCCSRPRKRLFFFVSVPIDASFRVFLDDLVGAENIYTYGQYLEAKQ